MTIQNMGNSLVQWSHFLRGKYWSSWWRDLVKWVGSKAWFWDSLVLKVGDGRETMFWEDIWCPNGLRLMECLPRLSNLDVVKDCVVRDRLVESRMVWRVVGIGDAPCFLLMKVLLTIWLTFSVVPLSFLQLQIVGPGLKPRSAPTQLNLATSCFWRTRWNLWTCRIGLRTYGISGPLRRSMRSSGSASTAESLFCQIWKDGICYYRKKASPAKSVKERARKLWTVISQNWSGQSWVRGWELA